MSQIIIKTCPVHGETEFVLRKDGRYRCKKCAKDAVQKRRYVLKQKAIEYKGGKCEICGYDKSMEALEFHHLNPNEKEFGFSHKGYAKSWDSIKKELDKCILVCANCHREIHAQEYQKEEFVQKYNEHKEQNLNNKQQYLDVNLILEDIKNGLIQKEMANKYSISISTLKRFLIKNNISMR